MPKPFALHERYPRAGIRVARASLATMAALTLAACAGTPDAAPLSPGQVEKRIAGTEVCRYGKPTGSHVARRICRSHEQDEFERMRAGALLQRSIVPRSP